jgi:hypothetical protein
MMNDTATAWLVYDRREGKFACEFTHDTNYVDEASRFGYDKACKMVTDAAISEWPDGKPPVVMIPDLDSGGTCDDLVAQVKAAGLLIKAATERMIADRAEANWSHPVPIGGLPEKPGATATSVTTASLADRARAAYEQADAVKDAGYERERAHRIAGIIEALAKLGLTPSGQPFTNLASHRVCVPLIDGNWDDESETQIHSVAAEWDDDTDDPGLVLVADLDLGEDWNAKRLYPAGRLNGLADLGRAIMHGGSTAKDSRVPTIGDLVDNSIRAARNAADEAEGYETVAMVHAADAICTALLDVAAAVREGR